MFTIAKKYEVKTRKWCLFKRKQIVPVVPEETKYTLYMLTNNLYNQGVLRA